MGEDVQSKARPNQKGQCTCTEGSLAQMSESEEETQDH